MTQEKSKSRKVEKSKLAIGNWQLNSPLSSLGKGGGSRRAVILPVVLFVLVMIGLLSAAFAFRIHADHAAVQAGANRLQTRLAAEAGIERMKFLLRTSRFDRMSWYNNPEMLNRVIVWANGQDSRIAGTTQELDETMVYRFSVVADDPTDDRDYVRFGVTDESSKLNINTCTEAQLLHLVTAVTQGDQTINPKEIVAAILDWRDTDSTPRSENGDTEGKYYEELKVHPYRVKNGPFTTVEELLLVKGVTPQILHGEDFDQNGLLTPNEDDGDKSFPPDNQDGQLNRGLAPYVTVWSAETNVSNDNRARAYLLGDQEALRAELDVAFPNDPMKVDFAVNASRTLIPAPGGGQKNGGQKGGGQSGGDQSGDGQQGPGAQGDQQGGSQQGGDQPGQGNGQNPQSGNPTGSGTIPGGTKPGGSSNPGGTKQPTGQTKNPGGSGGMASLEETAQQFDFMGLTAKVVAGAKVYADSGADGETPAGAVSRQVKQPGTSGGPQRPGATSPGTTSGSTGNPGSTAAPGGGQNSGASGGPGGGKGNGPGGTNPQGGQTGSGQQGGGQDGGQQGQGQEGDGGGKDGQGESKPTAHSPAGLLFGAKIDGRDVDSPLTLEDLPVLMDHLTMAPSGQKKIPGLININTAPRLVLECIEGITPEQIEGILKTRDSLDPVAASTTAWLVADGVMDLVSYDKIANSITARGQQFTVESLGFSDFQGMVTRLQAIVELNGPVAQTVYFRDVSYLGSHFPIREEDAKKIRRVH